jgi:hypothetical protein
MLPVAEAIWAKTALPTFNASFHWFFREFRARDHWAAEVTVAKKRVYLVYSSPDQIDPEASVEQLVTDEDAVFSYAKFVVYEGKCYLTGEPTFNIICRSLKNRLNPEAGAAIGL